MATGDEWEQLKEDMNNNVTACHLANINSGFGLSRSKMGTDSAHWIPIIMQDLADRGRLDKFLPRMEVGAKDVYLYVERRVNSCSESLKNLFIQ